jgi:acetyl-CoA carboxylase beta subunit
MHQQEERHFMPLREDIKKRLFNPPTSVVSNEEMTKHMYTCGKCMSWTYSETLMLDKYICEHCKEETTELHHTVLRNKA